MTRQELIRRLVALQEEMLEVGTAMDYYGGFDSAIAQHGREMVGASGIVSSWLEGVGWCRKCGGEMKPGKAIAQTLTGIPDFNGDEYAVTVSPGGSGRLIECMKCSECGWSITKGDGDGAEQKTKG